MIMVLYMNYDKKHLISYSASSSALNGIAKVLYLWLRFDTFKSEFIGSYISVSLGACIGAVSGYFFTK